MDNIQAWREVFNLSYGKTWQAIPENLKKQLGLDSRVGIMGGILCTKHTANYVKQFLDRLNAIGGK